MRDDFPARRFEDRDDDFGFDRQDDPFRMDDIARRTEEEIDRRLGLDRL